MNIQRILAAGLLATCLFLSACGSSGRKVNPAYTPEEQAAIDDLYTHYAASDYMTVIAAVDNSPLSYSGSLAFRSQALKYKAFSQCAINQTTSCHATIRQLLMTNPGFDLDVSEKNHPIWGPLFRSEQAKLQQDFKREAPTYIKELPAQSGD